MLLIKQKLIVSFPVMCVLYKNETYESLRAIMFAILSRAPAMKNVNEITTELTETVIKVVRLCFQLAKIKCTWYYYIQETSQAWIKLKLPFDVESIYKDENKLLRYTWALPLALQHQKAEEFNDIITILNDLQDLPNDSDIFMDTLDEKWKTRLKYILPYPMNEYADMLEIAERKLAIGFLTGKKTILGILPKKRIIDAGIETSYNLEKFLEKALTEDAVVRITSKIIMEQPCNMHVSATAGLNDLECAHTDDIENELIPAFYKRVHLKGPIDNSQKKIKRLEVIENVLNEVVNETDVSSDNDDMSMFESSPYFDSDITEDDHYDEPLQKVSLSKMKQKTNIEQEISLTSSSKKVKDTSSFTLEKQLLQSEIVICDTETTTFNDKISKTNFFTLDNDNNHQEDCSVSDPLDINLPKPKRPKIISSKILAKNLHIDKSNQRKDEENCNTLRTRRARESKTSKWLDDFIILEDRKKKREKNKENKKESDESVEKRKCT
ncbi:uncharacterized protein LOC122855108 [Aphidius gifuensis]|uniref:uncharacterized protein LOC122855108 n=1 Tax=Aphidius gifuensis TaxID=684658 RepID=UPI001CDC28F8|nr:uncharacterized protein LOC122855108 [Aphidius gifuensis]